MHKVAESLFDLLDDYEWPVIKKGSILYNVFKGRIAMLTNDGEIFTLRIPSENSNLTYNVTLDTIELSDECTCPAYEGNFYCKHIAVALFYVLIEHFDISNELLNKKYNLQLNGVEKGK